MLALPVNEVDIETIRLFDDPFLLAVTPVIRGQKPRAVTARDIDQERLILLEEGHCLRDQALAYCASVRAIEAWRICGSASRNQPPTVMQMVANVMAYPRSRVAVDVEVRDEQDKAVALRAARALVASSGLPGGVRRRVKVDFLALGQLVTEMLACANADMRVSSPRRRRQNQRAARHDGSLLSCDPIAVMRTRWPTPAWR